MLKIIAVCGNGMGTSMIIKMKVEKILNKLNVRGQVDAVSLGEAGGAAVIADIIVCSTHLSDKIPQNKAKIVAVKNLMDEHEIEQGLKKVI